MNEMQIEYLRLKPPVHEDDSSPDTIRFSDKEKNLIKNSEYPDYISVLDVDARASAAAKARHKLLYELYVKAKTDENDTLLNWVLNMLVIETSCFVKNYVTKNIANKYFFVDAINQCYTIIFREFPKIGSKLGENNLLTLLTRPLQQEIPRAYNRTSDMRPLIRKEEDHE